MKSLEEIYEDLDRYELSVYDVAESTNDLLAYIRLLEERINTLERRTGWKYIIPCNDEEE